MVYAHLQLGEDKAAGVLVTEMSAIASQFDPERGTHVARYALAASPGRYMIERGDWKGAAQLQVRPTRFAHTEAITHFARALGAARTADLQSARNDIAKLAGLRDRLSEAKDAYWSEQVNIQMQVASAWLLHAEGKHDDALTAMSAAADAEDKTEKATVTPGPVAPARELCGVMLLERGGMAKQALAAFEATLRRSQGGSARRSVQPGPPSGWVLPTRRGSTTPPSSRSPRMPIRSDPRSSRPGRFWHVTEPVPSAPSQGRLLRLLLRLLHGSALSDGRRC
jgi:hypothetical protein